jgi:hypothetical protein
MPSITVTDQVKGPKSIGEINPLFGAAVSIGGGKHQRTPDWM